MKTNFKSIDLLLNDSLSLGERGILITILLLKEKDSKITLAKCKSKINFSKNKESLIKLHEEGFIVWSGYKAAKKSVSENPINPSALEVLDFLNTVFGKSFKSTTKSNLTGINQRLKEYTVEDLKLVVSNRFVEWKDNATMKKHLNPETVFRASKFEKYLIEARDTEVGLSILNAQKISLKKGDLLTKELSEQLTDNDFYNIKIVRLIDGRKVGSGISAKKSGIELKRLLKIGSKESKYFYEGR